MKFVTDMDTKIGKLYLIEEDGALRAVSFHPETVSGDEKRKDTPLLKKTKKQMEEYLAGKRKEFDLPLILQGTAFQKEVWEALLTIPYGETRTYGEIARQIGRDKAFRAVGMANHNNPIAVIVPCHRVIGSNGSLTGYGGGLDIKKYLLELEQGGA